MDTLLQRVQSPRQRLNCATCCIVGPQAKLSTFLPWINMGTSSAVGGRREPINQPRKGLRQSSLNKSSTEKAPLSLIEAELPLKVAISEFYLLAKLLCKSQSKRSVRHFFPCAVSLALSIKFSPLPFTFPTSLSSTFLIESLAIHARSVELR